jgi:hypothetical protein
MSATTRSSRTQGPAKAKKSKTNKPKISKPACSALVTVGRGCADAFPTMISHIVGIEEYHRFLRIHRETGHLPWHPDNDAEGTIDDVVIKRNSDFSNMYALGPYPGYYYKPSAFELIPSFGAMLGVEGCEYAPGARRLNARVKEEQAMNLCGMISIVSLTDGDPENKFIAVE